MGNTNNKAYQLHKACPSQQAVYWHCQSFFLENQTGVTFAPQELSTDPSKPQPPPRRIYYRSGVEVSDPVDLALASEIFDAHHPNYACRDAFEDMKSCIQAEGDKKFDEFKKRKEEENLRKKEGK